MKYFKFYLIMLFTLWYSFDSYSQEKIKIKDLRKAFSPGNYSNAIALAKNYLKQEPNDFEANYLIATGYDKLSNEVFEERKKVGKQVNGTVWGDAQYEQDIASQMQFNMCYDSVIVYYKFCEKSIDNSFLKKNSMACSSGIGACYNDLVQYKSQADAQTYFKNSIKNYEDVLKSNKVLLQKSIDSYEQYKKNIEDEKIKKEKEKGNQVNESNAVVFTASNLNKYTNKTYAMTDGCAPWGYGVELKLNANKTYSAECSLQDYLWECSGKFEISSGTLLLTPQKCGINAYNVKQDCNKTLGKAKIEIFTDTISLYYTQFIKVTSLVNNYLFNDKEKCNYFIAPIKGFEVKAGSTRKCNNTKIITMAMKNATLIREVELKSEPNENAASVEFEIEGETGWDSEMVKTVPITTSISIVGRTFEKSKVNNTEDYWYLVNPGYYTKEKWIHGSNLKF